MCRSLNVGSSSLQNALRSSRKTVEYRTGVCSIRSCRYSWSSSNSIMSSLRLRTLRVNSNALKDSWQKVANMSNPACVPYVRRCVPLLRRQVGVDTPAGEHAAFGAFSRHFRPDIAVRKWHYDKGRYTQGRTSLPQSPATRGFFSFRARYTFSRNSKIQVNTEPRNALASRNSAVLCACIGR